MRAIGTSLVMILLAWSAAPCGAQEQGPGTLSAAPRTRNVAIVVHEGVELLDFAGPAEVFQAAASHGGAARDTPWFKVYTVAPKPGLVVSQRMLKIEPEFTIADCPKPDILVIPGGATGLLTNDADFMAWVRDGAGAREITLTVCTGAFVPAELGMLDGKQATTHWSAIDGLRRTSPAAEVLEDVRFVDNGAIITTAGVSAGIDGALHVVGRLLGREAAQETARYMEYDWRPEARTLASYPDSNPQLGGRGQAMRRAEALRREKKWDDAARAYEAIVKERPRDGEAWYHLGYCLHAAGHLDRAIEAHIKAAELDDRPQRPLYNLACAYALKGEKSKAIEALGRAIDAGFKDKAFMETDSDLDSLRGDERFQALMKRLD